MSGDWQVIDNTPKPAETLRFLRNQGLNWRIVLSELIDNAFDQNANSVRISIAPKRITVVDDGRGCGESGLRALLTLGGHIRTATTHMGRYGIGSKDATIWIGGNVQYATVHNRRAMLAAVNWSAIKDWKAGGKLAAWNGSLSEFCAVHGIPQSGGMSITVGGSDMRRVPAGQDFSKLAASLGFIYAPALRSGRQILMSAPGARLTPIAPYTLPAFAQQVNQTVMIDGRSVRVTVGAVAHDAPNDRPGINLLAGYRVIEEQTALGCNGFSVGRVAGEVELGSEWQLDKNKTKVTEEDMVARLDSALRPILLPVLSAAQQQSFAFAVRGLQAKVNDALAQAFADHRKEKRDRGNSTGTHEPRGSGRKRERARQDQPGHGRLRGPDGPVQVDFMQTDDPIAYRVDLTCRRVMFNMKSDFIARLRDGDNVDALCLQALNAYFVEVSNTDGGLTSALPGLENVDGSLGVKLSRAIYRALPPGPIELRSVSA